MAWLSFILKVQGSIMCIFYAILFSVSMHFLFPVQGPQKYHSCWWQHHCHEGPALGGCLHNAGSNVRLSLEVSPMWGNQMCVLAGIREKTKPNQNPNHIILSPSGKVSFWCQRCGTAWWHLLNHFPGYIQALSKIFQIHKYHKGCSALFWFILIGLQTILNMPISLPHSLAYGPTSIF